MIREAWSFIQVNWCYRTNFKRIHLPLYNSDIDALSLIYENTSPYQYFFVSFVLGTISLSCCKDKCPNKNHSETLE